MFAMSSFLLSKIIQTNYSEALNTNDWWEVTFPFENAKTIINPTSENLKKIFGNKFPESFYQSFGIVTLA